MICVSYILILHNSEILVLLLFSFFLMLCVNQDIFVQFHTTLFVSPSFAHFVIILHLTHSVL